MRCIIYALLSSTILYGHRARAQSDENTGNLYTSPADSADGAFVFPRTWPLTFREGSTINITWATTYDSINLYYYQRGNVANSIQIATNQGIPWYQWQVFAEETNLTEPYVFRVVKATGSDDEVKGGGFWSTSYYISRTEEDSSASQSSISPTSPSATSSTPEASRTSSPTSTPPSTLTGAPIVSSTQPPTGEATQTPPSSGVGTGAIIGLAVGLSLALIIIVAGAFLILRRRKQKSTNRSSVHQPPELPATTDIYGHGVTKGDAYTDVPHEVYVQPSEMQGSNTFFELPASRSSPRV